jgi:hypothetical protein
VRNSPKVDGNESVGKCGRIGMSCGGLKSGPANR